MSGPTETSRLLGQSGETGQRSGGRQGGDQRRNRIVYPALSDHAAARLKKDRVNGPLPFFNSTRADFGFPPSRRDNTRVSTSSDNGENEDKTNVPFLEWRARDNRKGRHTLIIPRNYNQDDPPQLSRTLSSIAKGIWRMLTVFAYWDVSWWIGVLFSIGCALFIVTGVLKVGPQAAPGLGDSKKELIGGIAACIGATLFAVAGFLLVIEASNENQTGCFGWAIEQTVDQALKDSNGSSSVDEDAATSASRSADNESSSWRVQQLDCQHSHDRRHLLQEQHPHARRTWKWLPSWHEFTTQYIHDIGFLGSIILAIGTIIFWVSGILSIPALSQQLSPAAMKWTYWLAFLIGGFHFATASVLYMLESQRQWYLPNVRSLSWWIGFWDLVGSVGWCLSAGLGGYCSKESCAWHGDVALLWASIAFEIGSLLLWYEALDKYPVERGE